MPAVLHLDESNGDPTETVTHAIASVRLGTVDQAELASGAPGEGLGRGAHSLQKVLRVHLTDLGGGGGIRGLRLFGEPPVPGWTLHTNLSDDAADYAAAKVTTYVPPAFTEDAVPYALPAGDPGVPNLGIGGDLAGALVAPGQSDYAYLQARASADVAQGFGAATGPNIAAPMRLFLAYDELG